MTEEEYSALFKAFAVYKPSGEVDNELTERCVKGIELRHTSAFTPSWWYCVICGVPSRDAGYDPRPLVKCWSQDMNTQEKRPNFCCRYCVKKVQDERQLAQLGVAMVNFKI